MMKLEHVLILAALCAWPTLSGSVDHPQTQETMQQIFETLRVILPLSVNEERFRDPIHQAIIEQSLQQLAQQSAALSTHANNTNVGFAYLGRSLASFATEAYRHYGARRYKSTQVDIQGLTNICIACHSRLPSPGDSPLVEGFVSSSQLAQLPLVQRAALQVATCQFDAAIETYELMLLDPSIHSVELVSGPLTDYLILCIRVKDDLSRPVPTLMAFSRRVDLWRSIKADIHYWIETLNTLRDAQTRPATLAQGRELIHTALSTETYAMDRRPLVHYIAASSVFNRFIEAQNAEGLETPAMAEAYFLLGLTEYRIDRDFWVAQAGHYLEASIRLAPDQPVAQQAFALLEEETLTGYTGSSGTHVPLDVQENLDELRNLVDTSPHL